MQEVDQLKKVKSSSSTNESEVTIALRREIEQLKRASPNGGLRLKELEDEKNALLDYIEENIEKQHSPLDARGGLLEQVKTLTLEKSHLLQAKEDYKRRLAESEEQRRSEVSRLEEDLEEAHKLLNLRLEEYQSVNRHSMIQENTFGNILPQNGVMSPDNHMIPMPQSNNDTLRAFDSVKLSSSAAATGNNEVMRENESLAKRVEDLEHELDDQQRKAEKERQELWERVRTLEQDTDLRVDELMQDNDALIRQTDQLVTRCKAQQENLQTLTQTLNETQNELEALVSDHERLNEQAKELQDLTESYRKASEDSLSELQKQRNESLEVKRELGRAREDLTTKRQEVQALNEQLYKADCEIRDLKLKLSYSEDQKQARDWENTCEDLAKELKHTQGELTQKEMVFQRVEQELRQKLNQMGDVKNDEKCELVRRLEDLQGEVRHLQNAKGEKEQRLKMQVVRNEQLLDQLERINMELTQAKEEREMTLHGKSEKEREAERDKERVRKVTKQVERLLHLVKSKVETAAHEVAQKFQFEAPQTQHNKRNFKRENFDSADLEKVISESEQILKALHDWLSLGLTDALTERGHMIQDLKGELESRDHKFCSLESKYKRTLEEENDLKEKEQFITTEMDGLKEKLRSKDEERQESFQREERMQRQCQQIKA